MTWTPDPVGVPLTVAELIEKLQTVEDKSLPVRAEVYEGDSVWRSVDLERATQSRVFGTSKVSGLPVEREFVNLWTPANSPAYRRDVFGEVWE